MKIFAYLLPVGLIMSTSAKSQLCISPEAENFFEKAMNTIKPAHSNWVISSALKIRVGTYSIENAEQLGNQYRTKVPGLGDFDIDALMSLLLMQVAIDASNDLRSVLDEMKKTNEQKKKIRDAVNRLKQLQKEMKEMQRDEYDSLRGLLISSADFRAKNSVLLNRGKITSTDIDKLLEDLRDKRDSLSEQGEEQSLKMQMYMDRMTKADSAASNLLKKFSETASQIIQNLK
jgi:hypothetical protein